YGIVLWAAARIYWVDALVYPATLLLALAWLPGINEVQHRLPSFTYTGTDGQQHDYYDHPVNLFLVEPQKKANGDRESDTAWKQHRYDAEKDLRAGKSPGPEAKALPLIDSRTMFNNWHRRISRPNGFFPGRPRPAIVLTVSGGASTSALYSACLLF